MTSWKNIAKLLSQIAETLTYRNGAYVVPRQIRLIEERYFCDLGHL